MVKDMEKYKVKEESREVVCKLPNGKKVVKVSQVLVDRWGSRVKREFYAVED